MVEVLVEVEVVVVVPLPAEVVVEEPETGVWDVGQEPVDAVE